MDAGLTNEQTFLQAMAAWNPRDQIQPIYRLYHDSAGNPLYYSMEQHPGRWIEVSCQQYHRASHKVTVANGILVPMPEPKFPKLRPSTHGVRCHAQNVAIVVDRDPSRYWRQNVKS